MLTFGSVCMAECAVQAQYSGQLTSSDWPCMHPISLSMAVRIYMYIPVYKNGHGPPYYIQLYFITTHAVYGLICSMCDGTH